MPDTQVETHLVPMDAQEQGERLTEKFIERQEAIWFAGPRDEKLDIFIDRRLDERAAQRGHY